MPAGSVRAGSRRAAPGAARTNFGESGLTSLTAGLAPGSPVARLGNTTGRCAAAPSSGWRLSGAPEPAPKRKPLLGYLGRLGFVEAATSSRGSTTSRRRPGHRSKEDSSPPRATQGRAPRPRGLGAQVGHYLDPPGPPTPPEILPAQRPALQPEAEVTRFREDPLSPGWVREHRRSRPRCATGLLPGFSPGGKKELSPPSLQARPA